MSNIITRDDFMDVREITQNALLNLIQIWSTMYDPSSEELPSRRRRFVELLREYLNTLIDEEAELSENLRNQIIQKIQEFDELQTALEIPQSKRKNWAVKYPYKDILKQIEGDMKAYKEMRDKRLENLRSLKNKEMELCKFLELSPVPDFPNPIPSESQMDEVELHIFHLREELNKRANNTFNESKTRIINLISELEYEVHDDFGNEILSKNSSEFQITTSNMVKLREFVQSLENKYEEKLGYRECLLDKLKKLWDLIKVNEVEREKFLSCYPSTKKSHINALRNEIERCEEIKLAMLKPIIESVREELQQIWDLLALSSEERLKFKAFTTDHVSEDILDLHEFELEELKAFYEKYKPLYELIEKRKALWERMRHLDLLAADKTRLFSNRGGQLLKEDKERKSLEVNVPKIDKQLKEALEEFEKEEGRPFLYHGSNLLEEVIRAWDERLTAKENSKPGKNVVKKPGVVAEKGFTPSFPLAKRKLGTPLTNLSTPKSSRKFEETMIIEVPWAIGKLPVIPVVSSCNANISASSTNASYSHFQDGLETPISALKQRDHSSPSKSPHLRL